MYGCGVGSELRRGVVDGFESEEFVGGKSVCWHDSDSLVTIRYEYFPMIRFIQPSDHIFDQRHLRSYLMQLDQHEYQAKTGQRIRSMEELIGVYGRGVLEWSTEEVDEIRSVIREADRYVYEFKALRKLPWKLVKWDGRLEWGMPFTLDDMIFIPSTHLRHGRLDLAKTLVHEKIHVDQRRRPGEYRELYERDLGWRYHMDMVFPLGIYGRMIHNPDGMDRRWSLDGIVMLLMKEDRGLRVVEEFYTLGFERLGGSEGLRRVYGTDEHMYHPNEMVAHVLSNWIFGIRYRGSVELEAMIKFAER